MKKISDIIGLLCFAFAPLPALLILIPFFESHILIVMIIVLVAIGKGNQYVYNNNLGSKKYTGFIAGSWIVVDLILIVASFFSRNNLVRIIIFISVCCIFYYIPILIKGRKK